MFLISLAKSRLRAQQCRRYQGAQTNELFLTVADSDFKVARHITKAVAKRVKTGNITYTYEEAAITNSIKKWYENQFEVHFNKDQILFGNGVLYWIHVAIYTFSQKSENILIMPPVYEPFSEIITRCERKILTSPLIFEHQKWKINWLDLEQKMKQAPLMVFCSPHNPTGTIWSKQDWKKLLILARKYKTIIVVDEIWQDIILNNKFIHSLTLDDQQFLIHLASPAKTFNLGGLQFGFMISKNNNLVQKMRITHQKMITYSSSQPWISTAVKTSYEAKKSLIWKDIFLKQIRKNVAQLTAFLDQKGYQYSYPEGTYLMFIKLGSKKTSGKLLMQKLDQYGLKVTSGLNYGPEYQDWIRVNIAISSKNMRKFIMILEKIKFK